MHENAPESVSLGRDEDALTETYGTERKTPNGRIGASPDRIVEVLARAGIESRAINTDVVGVEDRSVDPSTVDDLLPVGWEVVSRDDRPATVAREGRA